MLSYNMGDWNEWDDLKDTIVNEQKFALSKAGQFNSDKKDREVCTNKYTYYRKINETDKKKKRITMYSSNYVSGCAINAINNTMYNVRIGTNDEKYLFSVRFTTKKFDGLSDDVITLYYDNPYSYENHHGVSLNPKIISDWYTQFNKLPPRNTCSHTVPPPVEEVPVTVVK